MSLQPGCAARSAETGTTLSEHVRTHASNVPFSQGGGVIDIDGNQYETVVIGDQEWMGENLRVTHYRNGNPIDRPGTDYTSYVDWQDNRTGAYAWYKNDESMYRAYGGLYNWFAVTNEAGLCPAGWRVPTDEDWKRLESNVGMAQEEVHAAGWRGDGIAALLKSSRSAPAPHPRWDSLAAPATNASGFSGLPGGYRTSHGLFVYVGRYSHWWTSTEHTEAFAWSRRLESDSGDVTRFALNKIYGYSIRCLKQ